MASLLNNASLLLNPAGSIIAYEEDKILSVLPRNGAGDFTFSGGDGGTRVNQDGYIEQTPANLVTYSEDFSNWTGNLFNNWINLAATTDFAVAPNGTLTADRLGDGYARFNVSATAIPGQTYTFSIYLKNISLNANFYVYAAWGLNGTLVAYNTIGAQIQISQLSTTEWTRFTFSTTAPSSGINQMQFGPAPFTGYGTNPAGTFILAWGGMVNIGTTAKPYQPTTDRLNYPRITYQNGRGALLSEPQRTNLALYSNIFTVSGAPGNNNGLYFYNLATLNSTNNLSPDGTNNAYNITMHNASYDMYSTFTGLSIGTTYSYSVYVKLGSATNFAVVVNNTAAWNTVAGSQTFTNLNDTNYTRVTITFVAPSTGQVNIHLGGHSENITQQSSGDVYIWGEQFEAGTYPTSYIPTTSATVTRPADSTNNTNTTNVASIVGQTEGVFYSDLFFEPNGAERNYMYLNTNNSYNNGFFYLIGTATNILAVDIYNFPNTQQFSAQSPTLTAGRYKAAIAYKQNDFAFYLNGVQIATDNSGTVPTLNRMYIGQGSDLGWTNGAPVFTTGFFPTRLTNTQLAELTTVRSGSGGNISYYGPYTVHTFTGSATFTPSFNGQVEVLVVAGGGGGGQNHGGGGGGAGGLLYTSAYGVSAGSGITVTVGSGGAIAGNGSNSVFGGLTTIGGGLGASEGANNGGNGGSGGGGTGFSTATNGGSGIPGQGFDGGKGGFPDTSGVYGSGGGGGGASAPGTDGKEGVDVSGSAGNGGNGLPYSITGFSTYYAGGGGGGYWGSNLAYYGVGGLGGGGNGGAGISTTLLPTPGVNGLGGGGGGSRGDGSQARPGSIGGSGVVIVRYLT